MFVQDHQLIRECVGHLQKLLMKTSQNTEDALDQNLLMVSICLVRKQRSLEMKNLSFMIEGVPGPYLEKINFIEAAGQPQEVWMKINPNIEGGPGQSL